MTAGDVNEIRRVYDKIDSECKELNTKVDGLRDSFASLDKRFSVHESESKQESKTLAEHDVILTDQKEGVLVKVQSLWGSRAAAIAAFGLIAVGIVEHVLQWFGHLAGK